MDSTSPIAHGIAGQPNADSGSAFKSFFGMGFLTLVDNCFVGRRRRCWLQRDASDPTRHRRYHEHHHRSADGHGRAS
ncbi:hypothetical protein [Halorussus litoreus]|uniref:hypothetical protein n=1 Tax=Halorussus litoreus TaxID=1710536 RepID=UPI000E21DF38|nr:hypothetical protein [Halorussus litoreus]